MTDLLALQSTPALPEATGGGTSPLAILTVVAAIGYVVQTRTAIDLLGLVPSLGGSGGGSGGSSSSGSGGLLGFVVSINGLAIGVLTLLTAFVVGGMVDLPRGTGVAVVVTLILVATALILDELGGLSPRLFLAVVAATVLIALSATGEPIVGAVVNSPVGPLAVIGAIALGWRWLGQDRTRNIIVRGEVEDDDEGGEQ
jgi:hypothetical protein